MYDGTRPIEVVTCDWDDSLCANLGVIRGESAYLAFFESLVVLISLALWCGHGGLRRIAIIGDNLAALTVAISHRGRGDLGRVCREVALRQARWNLEITVGHLPTADNGLADALSRLTGPSPAAFPPELVALPRRRMPPLAALFRIEPPAEADSLCHLDS